MQRDEVIDAANSIAFFASIWIDDNSNEVNDLVNLAQVLISRERARVEMLEMEVSALEEKLSEARELFGYHNKVGYKHGYRSGILSEQQKINHLMFLFQEWKEDHMSQSQYIECVEEFKFKNTGEA